MGVFYHDIGDAAGIFWLQRIRVAVCIISRSYFHIEISRG